MSQDPYIGTIKEALIAEMLGDINKALLETAELMDKLESAEKSMLKTAKTLTVAGEKYKQVINEFTEETKIDIENHIKINSKSELSHSVKLYKKEIQKITTSLFNETVNKKLKKTNTFIYFLIVLTTISTTISMIASFIFINQHF